MVDTCLYTFIQTHRMHNINNEPYCKLRTLGDNVNTGSLVLTKTALVGNADNQGTLHECQQEFMKNLLCSIVINLKLLSKKKLSINLKIQTKKTYYA